MIPCITFYNNNQKEILKIYDDGHIEICNNVTLNEASRTFWDIVQIEGLNSKIEHNYLIQKIKYLEARVEELEICLGYRPPEIEEERKSRFE